MRGTARLANSGPCAWPANSVREVAKMTGSQFDDLGAMAGGHRIAGVAERVAQLLASEFGDDPDWRQGHSLDFLLNMALFDVLAVLNAPDSLKTHDNNGIAGRFKDYVTQADDFRGDFLAMCASLHRIEPGSSDEKEARVYESGLSCFDCGRPIFEGEPMWTVDVQHESLDRGVIDVFSSEIALVYCEACAGGRDFARVRVPRTRRALRRRVKGARP